MMFFPKNFFNFFIFFKKLSKDRLAFFALLVLVIMYTTILFAGFFAPYGKMTSYRKFSYSPPSKIFVIDKKGSLSFPYTYNYKRVFNEETFQINYIKDQSQKYYLKLFIKGDEYKLLGFIPCNIHFLGVDAPGKLFVLGTDLNGRDILTRLLYGGQISLTIGFFALLISFPIGLIYGGIAGYFGGVVDNLMMRFAEAVMSIPAFYVLISLAAVLPANMTSIQRFSLITAILAFIGWAGLSRIVRGMVLSIKNLEFVEASKSLGASSFRIISRHILPQTASFIIVAITLSVPGYILSESGLSFLGLGIQQPEASWGNMLKEAQEYTNIMHRPWLLTPGLLIFSAVLAFNLIGDAVRDILDPKAILKS